MSDRPTINLSRLLGLDKDTDPRFLVDGHYIDARNIHLGGWIPQKGGVPTFMRGTTEIPWTKPAGNSRGIGAYYDPRFDEKGQPTGEKDGYLYGFLYNDQGNHTILRYSESEGVQIIAQSSVLNFKNHPITGIDVVDNRFLQWTDYNNRPREIDVDRAILEGKTVELRGYVRITTELVDNRDFSATITDGTNITTVTSIYTASQADVFQFNPMMRGFVAAFNASVLGQSFTAEFCDDYIQFVANQPGPDYNVDFGWVDTISGTPGGFQSGQVGYTNRYNFPWTEEQLSRAKISPTYPPIISLVRDEDRTINLIERRVFQFATAYRFVDKSQSTVSPISLIPVDDAQCGVASFNTIEIDFWTNDQYLQSPAMRGEIEAVELLFREGTENVWGNWRSIEVIPKAKWIFGQPYIWLNDGIYPAVDQIWANLLFSQVPVLAQSCATIYDNENNFRTVFGGTVENYPNPCLDVKLTPRYEDEGIRTAGGITVTGYFRGVNPFLAGTSQPYINYQPIHQPDPDGPVVFGGFGPPGSFQQSPSLEDYGQEIGTTGFVIFAAGTDRFAISTQNVPQVPCGGGSTNSPTIANGFTDVYDSSQSGGSITACNATHRASIRQAIQAGQVYSTFELTGLPPNTELILRVADLRVSFDNPEPYLDLNNPNLLWQLTSAPVARVGSVSNANVSPGVFECRITTPASGTLDIGEVNVVDLTSPGILGTIVKWGYLTDSEAQDNSGSVDIREGTRMARQAAHMKAYLPGNIPTTIGGANGATYLSNNSTITPNPVGFQNGLTVLDGIINQGFCPTDHNGFWYFAVEKFGSADLRDYRIGFASITANPSIPTGSFAGYTGSQFQTSNLLIGNNFNQNKWLGDWGTTLSSTSGNLGNTTGLQRFFMPNLSSDIHEGARTRVEGTIATAGGTPLRNVLVVLEDGSFDRTDSQGFYSIPTYGEVFKNDILNNNQNDRVTNIIINWDSACQIQITAGNIQPININSFEENQQYSNLIPFVRNLQGSATATGIPYAYKRGGGNIFGVAIKDQYGLMTRIQEVGDLRYAHLTEDLFDYDPITYSQGTFKRGPVRIDWEIGGTPPTYPHGYGTHLQFFSTRDTVFRNYLQWAVATAQYVSTYNKETQEPTFTSFNSGSDNEVYLYIGDSFVKFREDNADAATGDDLTQAGQVGYQFQQGDRVRIFTDNVGDWLPEFIDVPILGQRGDAIVIETDSRLPELKGGEFIEIMTPRPDLEFRQFKEIPGAIVPINNPKTSPAWSLTSGTLPGGNTYYLSTQVPIRPGFVPFASPPSGVPWNDLSLVRESEAISDFYDSTFWHEGRINYVDDGADQEYRPTLVRFCETYLPQTTNDGLVVTNGMNIFYPLNLREATRDWGLIQKMVYINRVIVCICSNKRTFSIYTGIEEKNADGVYTSVDKVLAQIRPLAGEYGTLHPESVVVDRGMIKWVDITRGAVVKYDVNGLDPISDQRRVGSYFREKLSRLQDFDNTRIFGGLAPKKDEYLVSFPIAQRTVNNIDIEEPQDTIIYMEAVNKWTSRGDAIPEYYGNTTHDLFSFKNGSLYRHYDSDTYGNFYGQQYPMEITISVVGNPDIMKTWLAMWITANGGEWECPEISNNRGQESNLITTDFTDDLGVFKAAFLRNLNTPDEQFPLINGDFLKSRYLQIRIQYNGTEFRDLEGVQVFFVPNPVTAR